MNADDRIVAYVDGELPAPARLAFEAELRTDPALSEAVARERSLAQRVSRAYAPVLEEPVPARLLASARAARAANRSGFGPPQWAAMAAALVGGVLIGRAAFPERGPLVVRDGAVVAQGRLADALETRLAADPGVIKVGLTLRTADGRYCRSFQSEMDRLAGLACRDAGRWTMAVTTVFEPGRGGAYRTAASDIPAAVLAAVDELGAGDPLDAKAERSARDRNWTPPPER